MKTYWKNLQVEKGQGESFNGAYERTSREMREA